MRLLLSLVLSAAVTAGCALPPAAPSCPTGADVTHLQMLGNWRAEVEGHPVAMLTLQQHPIYREGFRGWLSRASERAEVSGDIDEGDFTMEESRDGTRISATWIGEFAEGSCGREIRGTWQAEGDALAKPFVMRRM